MPYQTGTASSPADLISKLAAFAAANGWAVQTLTDTHRVFSKGTIYCAVATTANTAIMRSCTGVDTGAAYTAQPGNAGASHTCNLGGGAYVSHTFYTGAEGSSDYLFAVVEVTSGVYRHLAIGKLVKFGSFTGGEFSDSTYWDLSSVPNVPNSISHRRLFDDQPAGTSFGSGQVRADIDGKTAPAWSLINNVAARGEATGSNGGLHAALYQGVGYQRYNLNTPLFPIFITIDRPSSLRSVLGRVPNMRLANLRNLSPGQILNIGGDEWQVWPQAARTDTAGSTGGAFPVSSLYMGVAIKRV